jgi:peptide/nickel transport system substrate-binding protein
MSDSHRPARADKKGPSGNRKRAAKFILALYVLVGIYSVVANGGATGWWVSGPNEYHGDGASVWKPAPADREPRRGGELKLALYGDMDSFNPYISTVGAEERNVFDLIFPRLAYEEPDAHLGPPTLRPSIAQSWQISTDGKTIRFVLRECSWSDGEPISADDVKFSWEVARSTEINWRHRSLVADVEDIEVHGPQKCSVHFKTGSPYNLLGIADVFIIPEHIFSTIPFEEWIKKEGKWRDAARVSGGPFRLETYKHNELVTLTRNPNYWEKGKPYIDRVHFRVFSDVDQLIEALLSQEIDVLRKVPFEKVSRVKSNPETCLLSYQSRGYGFVSWNNKREPFDDPRVRRAMTHAILRTNIVTTYFGERAKVAAPAVLSCFWASNKDIRPYPYDPAIAKQLLADAGFELGSGDVLERDGKPLAFQLLTNRGHSVRGKICEDIRRRLEGIGVTVNVGLIPYAELKVRVMGDHNYDAALLGMNAPTKVDLWPFYHSDAIDSGANVAQFENDQVDALIEQVSGVFDPLEAKKLWDEIQVMIHDLQPVTMLYEERGYAAYNKRVQNVRATIVTVYDNVPDWWLAE